MSDEQTLSIKICQLICAFAIYDAQNCSKLEKSTGNKSSAFCILILPKIYRNQILVGVRCRSISLIDFMGIPPDNINLVKLR